MKFILAREVKSGNAFAYSHWRARHADKQAWLLMLRVLVAKRTPPTERQVVTITAFRRRTLDDDNLIAGCKHLRDALIVVGLIADDDAKSAAFVYRQEKAKDGPMDGLPCVQIEVRPE